VVLGGFALATGLVLTGAAVFVAPLFFCSRCLLGGRIAQGFRFGALPMLFFAAVRPAFAFPDQVGAHFDFPSDLVGKPVCGFCFHLHLQQFACRTSGAVAKQKFL